MNKSLIVSEFQRTKHGAIQGLQEVPTVGGSGKSVIHFAFCSFFN